VAAHRLTWGGEPLDWGGVALFWGQPDDEPHGGGRPKKHGGWGRAPTRKRREHSLENDDDLAILLLL